MEDYEKILTIDNNQFLLKYLGSYQVEVFSNSFQEGSLLFHKNEWEEGRPGKLAAIDLKILESACMVLIDWNLKRPGYLFTESSGGL